MANTKESKSHKQSFPLGMRVAGEQAKTSAPKKKAAPKAKKK